MKVLILTAIACLLASAASAGALIAAKPVSFDQDEAVRNELGKRGDDGKRSREVTFYFYGGDLVGLRRAAEARGYKVDPARAGPGLVLRRKTAIDAGAFDPILSQMAMWAEQFHAEYDGWESGIAG